ncbi:HEPN domain-containing protein [Amycolatopsis circi]|uniref:HEPN domain-containing protein n=1 Tax=Amycolatopsis circi TaxID=871959 RepID=UPI0013BEA57D|nr:HEPN domain-containing protein [Amycolatopsis circi]
MVDAPNPRARLYKANGDIEDVSENMHGAQAYFDAWQNEVDTPQLQQVTAWQRSDDDHQPGAGRSAYRVVYKTLKIVPYPSVEMKWPNLKVNFYCGSVERGGIRFDGTISGRRKDQEIIPEHGRILDYGGTRPMYIRCPNLNFHVEAWEDTVQAVSVVEVIWVSDVSCDKGEALIDAGRTAVGPLLTQLEFEFGPRLLSTRIAEEAGEVFDDWHWNRRIFTGTVYAESQASLLHQDGIDFVRRFQKMHSEYERLSIEERERLRLASRWYWIAQEESDAASAFVQWWFIVETLEMPTSTDIKPAVAQIAALLRCDVSIVKGKVGRLFGMRSKVVHGKLRDVPDEWRTAVEAIARLLLAYRSGASAKEELAAARAIFGIQ